MSAEPLCALKVGSLACFCVCSEGNGLQESHEPELFLENDVGGQPLVTPSGRCAELEEDLSSTWPVRPEIRVESAQQETAPRRQDVARRQHERAAVVPQQPAKMTLARPESPATRADTPELQKRIEAALRAGRLLEANRDLQILESYADAERILGEAVVERITRVCSYHDRSKQMLKNLDMCGWITETSKDNNTMSSCKLGQGQFAVRMSFELQGDIVQAFAALLEFDVPCGFDRIVPSAGEAEVILSLAGAHNPMDSTWSVLSHEKNLASREDNVWQMSAIDTLDEDNALWICMYTPPPSTAKLREVIQRQIQPGRTRVKSGMGVYVLTPLTEGRFRLDMIMESELPRAAYRIMSWVPEFLFKRVLRARQTSFPGAFRRAIACPELEARMREGKRPELYGHIRRHITSEQEPAAAG